MNKLDTYGVWNFETNDWDFNANELDYNNAMSLALYCCETELLGERGAKSFAVVKHDAYLNPIWHEMAWHGGFQGYEWLQEHCATIGEFKNLNCKSSISV